jgi:hypothetical protein
MKNFLQKLIAIWVCGLESNGRSLANIYGHLYRLPGAK